MNTREQLEQSLAALEAQRAMLGDAVVDPAIAAIKAQLATLAPASEPEKQRKQVTVLFADVSGFTAMSETMDAEDVQETMNALWQKVDGAILEFNGRIDKHIGDAVMALWGVDEAREDDPEQAVRAALAMQTAVHTFVVGAKRASPLQMRIGINTGPVLLGEVGTTAEFTAMGDTVNTASRLEHAAPVGGILISHDTYRHVRGVFDVDLQEPLTVKGKAEPLQVYVVERAKARTFRTRTRGVEGVETRMVGRDEELERLKEVWETAISTPQTTLITVTGEAGVGKSRLLYEFEQWLDLQPEIVTLFKGRSAEQTRGTPYFLLRDMFSARFGIRESDPIAEVRQKFETAVAEVLPDAAEMKSHFLGQWLGYDFSHSPHVATIGEDAEQLKNRGLLYLSQFLKEMAGERPLLLFLEDIHWADSPSLDAILNALRREPELSLLVMALTRPSFFEHRPEWRELGQAKQVEIEGLELKEPAYHLVALAPLPSTADRELLAEILQKVAEIPEQLFELVAGRADGNPFYMEELVKMLIDDGVIVPDDTGWQVEMSRLNEASIPSTLIGVLQARLDRLAIDERVTLQRASVVGRVFWDTAVQQLGDDSNQIQLTPLQQRELIYQQSETAFAGIEQFLFKHDLLRDVTYQTVLKKARRLYHRQVADWLVEVAEANGRTAEYSAIIAEHYQLAGNADQTAHWYGRAGKDAVTRYAHDEAIHYLTAALDFAIKEDNTTRYMLLSAREEAYAMQGNREAQREDLAQLANLAKSLGVSEQAMIALRRAKLARTIGDYFQANTHAQMAIENGKLAGELNLVIEGYVSWGSALWLAGDYPTAQEQLLEGLQLAETVNNLQLISNCLHNLGAVASQQSDFVTATLYFERALAIREEIEDRFGKGHTLNNLAELALHQGDYASAKTSHEQVLEMWRDMGNRHGQGGSLGSLGRIAAAQGDFKTAKRYHEQALAIQREIDDKRGLGGSLINLGHLAWLRGEHGVATTYIEQSLAINKEISEPIGVGQSLNMLGVVAWSQGNYVAAKGYFEQALTLQRKINHKMGMGISLINLGGIAADLGEYSLAETHYEQAIVIFREIGNASVEGLVLHLWGVTALKQGRIEFAKANFQQAHLIHEDLQEFEYLAEDCAALAMLNLVKGEQEGAKQYAQKFLHYFKKTSNLQGAENRMRAFHYMWKVLATLGQSAEANKMLNLAAQIMQDYLDKNSEPAIQEMYLRQPHHRVLWAAWLARKEDD